MELIKYSFLVLLLIMINSSTTYGLEIQTEQKVYIKIEIDGLACPFCAYGMEKKLKKISGIDNVDIKLRQGVAYIITSRLQKPSAEDLKTVIVDAGFTPGKIEYSDRPFDRKNRTQNRIENNTSTYPKQNQLQ